MEFREYNCLFTHQLRKKRKIWSDGYIRHYKSSGLCSLYPARSGQASHRDQPLESKYISASESIKLEQQTLEEIEFENYTISVEYEHLTVQLLQSVPFSKVKRFKPPSKIDTALIEDGSVQVTAHIPNQTFLRSVAPYHVLSEELDDIWGAGDHSSRSCGSEATQTVGTSHAVSSGKACPGEISNSFESVFDVKRSDVKISVIPLRGSVNVPTANLRDSTLEDFVEIRASSPIFQTLEDDSLCNDDDIPLIDFCDGNKPDAHHRCFNEPAGLLAGRGKILSCSSNKSANINTSDSLSDEW